MVTCTVIQNVPLVLFFATVTNDPQAMIERLATAKWTTASDMVMRSSEQHRDTKQNIPSSVNESRTAGLLISNRRGFKYGEF